MRWRQRISMVNESRRLRRKIKYAETAEVSRQGTQ